MPRTKVARKVRTLTAVYEREGDMWVVHLAEEPRCHSWGRTVRQAKRHIHDAANLWFNVDSDALLIVDDVRPPAGTAGALRRATEARKRLEKAQGDTRRAWEDAARALVDKGHLSMRDAAAVLGISHQRVEQLLSSR